MGTRARVIVSGRVQGVFFRQSTAEEAQTRGVVGFVRNLPDGSLEAVFEGEEDAVNAMVEFCRYGPRGAKVTHVDVQWATPTSGFKSFEIL